MKRILNELKHQGYDFSEEMINHYRDIDEWEKWWNGYNHKFHQYQIMDENNNPVLVDRYRLNMGKRVSKEWADLLLTPSTKIVIDDEVSQDYLTNNQTGILTKNNFLIKANKTIEKAFALGSAAFILSINNAIKYNNTISEGELEIRHINNAKNIIPLRYEKGEIIDCAFVSLFKENENEYAVIEKHLKEGEGYHIYNECYLINKDGCKKVKLIQGILEEFYINTKLFFIIKPWDEYGEMGKSIFADAIDQIRGCDVIFDNVYRGLLGKRKVIDGKVSYVHDENKLNLAENINLINFFLKSLGSKVGLGEQYFISDTAVDLKNIIVDKKREILKRQLDEMIRSILILGKEYFKQSVDLNTKITIKF